ncbi:hypothetical protein [Endozoicomonas sp. SESOKO1]|uniref:hypothetical protein n=1 Tax=Endozoicomonas sp. SESOKO1 TaxID=2828742 RepID=UPI0021490D66|nr:hypothetical protein [Endozoicomonas sp. SESOKO1]
MLSPAPASVSPEEALCLQATRQCFSLEKKCCTFRGLHVTRLDVFRSLMLIVERTSVGGAVGGALGVVAGGIVGVMAGGVAGAVVGGIAGGAASAVVMNQGEGGRLTRALDGFLGGVAGGGGGAYLQDKLGIEGAAKGAIDGVIIGGMVGSTFGILSGIVIIKNNYFIRNRVVERTDPVVQLSSIEEPASIEEPDQMLAPFRSKTPIRREPAQSTAVIIENEEFAEDYV